MENLDRRRFLSFSLGGIAAASAVAFVYPVYRYLSPLPEKNAAAKITMPESDVREGEAKFFNYSGTPAVILKGGGGKIVAFSAVCTHLGCIIQWEKGARQFICPCHAGRYSPEGDVVSGPPPKPLKKLPVTQENGILTIG